MRSPEDGTREVVKSDELRYRRVLLKLSGEALAGEQGFGIAPRVVDRLTDEIKAVHEMGVALGLVIGGGNIVRGTQIGRASCRERV